MLRPDWDQTNEIRPMLYWKMEIEKIVRVKFGKFVRFVPM